MRLFLLLFAIFYSCFPLSSEAQRVKNAIAVFSGLDKITGKTTSFRVKVDSSYQFGALKITPRVCYTSRGGEARGPSSFVEILQENQHKETQKVFSGWMFASSPALNAMDHPVYDIWLTDCEQVLDSEIIQDDSQTDESSVTDDSSDTETEDQEDQNDN